MIERTAPAAETAPAVAPPPRIWALTDDRAGNCSQCLGVAEAMGLPFEVRPLAYAPAAAVFPNVLLGASLRGLTAGSRAALAPPWPDLVIAAGRRTAPVARAIKRKNRAAFLAQIMDPGGRLGDFDLVAVPRHDRRPPLPNVLETVGAPHRVTPAVLRTARAQWAPVFEQLPRPRIALIVGGSTKSRRFTADMARDLGRAASGLAIDSGGSLLVSTSRRTGDAAAAALFAELQAPAHVYRWDQGGDNPYLGYLALADAVIVTGDSMSMCTEACATTVPVYIFAPPGFAADKHARLHWDLYKRGYARPLGERREDRLGERREDRLEFWTHPPLNPAVDVADAIRIRLHL